MTEVLSLYLDHPKVGCGWRRYIVLQRGRKWARLLSTETAEHIRVPAGDLAHGKLQPLKRTRMLRRLRDVARTYGTDGTGAVKEALHGLRHPSPSP